ncbi:MAG: type IX secretion system membrane protein PorP/SprF [Saprospiraceae bacterium]
MQPSKKYSITLLLFLCLNFAKAQDVQFANTQALPMAINPALTGFISGTNNMRLTSAVRHQWPSLLSANSAYNTVGLSFDTRNCFPSTNNTKSSGRTEGPTWGLGGSLIHDRSGTASVGELKIVEETPLLRSFFDLSFSVILPAGKEGSFISGGLRAGGKLHRLDTDQLRFDEQFDGVSGYNGGVAGEFDEVESLNSRQLDLGGGIAGIYFGKKWGATAGVGFDHIFRKVNYDFVDTDDKAHLSRKYTVHSKLAFTAPKNKNGLRYGFVVRPLLFVYQKPYFQYISSLDLFVQTNDNTVVTFGGGFRMSRHVDDFQDMDAGFGNISLRINNITIGALYEVNTSRLAEATKHYGTVEISFAWRWKKATNCNPYEMGCDEKITHALFF